MNIIDKLRQRNQIGIVSIMITLIMMIVISLIILGFAQLSRREVRNSLDSQLSTQAYYAAESGINDAHTLIKNAIANGDVVSNKTTCADSGAGNMYSTLNAGTVDSSNNVSYSCITINAAPKSLLLNVGNASKVEPLFSSTGSFGSLTFSWTKASGAPPAGSCNIPGLPASGSWTCPYPMLRIDLVSVDNPLSRASLISGNKALFLKPSNSGGAVSANYVGTATGSVVSAGCIGNTCSVTFTNVPFTNGYMRVSSIYRDNTQLTISSNPNTGFLNAQALIDSTGKAQDVLRRVVVAVDLTDANAVPVSPAAIVSGDTICKRFSVAPGIFNSSAILGNGGNPFCSSNPSPSPPPPPPPPGGGGGGGTPPDGGAISGCAVGSPCTPGDFPFPRYGINRYITVVPSSAVKNCTWIWYDGSTTTAAPSQCLFNSKGFHNYKPVISGGKEVCMKYNIKLVWNLSSGGTITSNIKPADVPWGTDKSCPNP